VPQFTVAARHGGGEQRNEGEHQRLQP
jgi:hypothetical protein